MPQFVAVADSIRVDCMALHRWRHRLAACGPGHRRLTVLQLVSSGVSQWTRADVTVITAVVIVLVLRYDLTYGRPMPEK